MKKFLRLVLLLGVVLGLASGAGAEYYDEGHSGTASDPYVIDTNADLVMLRDRVNAGTESGDMYYKLTQNLNISQYTDWTPIGTNNHPFTGHFDGNNFSIHLNIPYKDSKQSALFGTVSTIEGYAIRNLAVSGEIGGKYVAGIALKLNSGAIENCSFTGSIQCRGLYSNSPYAGGIAGNMSGGSVTNSSFIGTIRLEKGDSSQVYYAGGITAVMTGGNIENCSVTSDGDGIYSHSPYNALSYGPCKL